MLTFNVKKTVSNWSKVDLYAKIRFDVVVDELTKISVYILMKQIKFAMILFQ